MTEPVPEPQPGASDDARIGALEAKVDKILDAISGGGPDRPEEPAGAPNVAEEIRRQLEERDARDAENADKQSLKDTVAGIQAQLAEKSPEPMPRRVEKFMGWR